MLNQQQLTPLPFPFDRNFQIGILALATQRQDFTGLSSELVQPQYFEDQILIWFFQRIKDYYLKFSSAPTMRVIENELRSAARLGAIKANNITQYADVARQIALPVADADYITSSLVKFCRRQAGRKIYFDTIPLMDNADDAVWDQITDQIVKIPSIGMGLQQTGIDPTVWDLQQDPARIAFGIHPVDDVMRGGLKPGQLGALIGGPGSGKSLGLLHIGATSMFKHMNVLYISLELGESDIAERFTSFTTGVPLSDLHNSPVDVSRGQLKVRSQHQGRFRIKFFPTATVNTIRAYLRVLAAQSWKPDMLLVDYGDLLSVTETRGSDYADQGNAFGQLRVLAGELNIPCWTATQANRAAFQAEKVSQEHIADSMRKARICDVLVGISAKPEERQQNLARLNFTKNRNGRENVEILITTDYSRARFCDISGTAQLQGAGAPVGAPPGMPPSAQPAVTTPKRRRPTQANT